QFAWQIFDGKVKHLLRDEYKIRQVTKRVANSLEELVKSLDDTDGARALEEIKRYNAAVRTEIPFNPNVKDGRRTEGLAVPKSNWANTIDTPPFEAYAVTCGITFSFGGLRINTDAQVISSDGKPIPGLYAAGEVPREAPHGVVGSEPPGRRGRLLSRGAVVRPAGQSVVRGHPVWQDF